METRIDGQNTAAHFSSGFAAMMSHAAAAQRPLLVIVWSQSASRFA